MTSPRHRVLVVRNDKLGDFMLAWPALKALKQASADIHITALVPHYTAELASSCPWVDDVIVDPGHDAPHAAQAHLLREVREQRFDAMLTLFSTPRVGWLGWRAGIPLRIAPATKWAQIFYNVRIKQRRSQSLKPEYRYNLELAEVLLARLNIAPVPAASPYWPVSADARARARDYLSETCLLDTERLWWCVHAGSGGSAVNLTPARYAELILSVDKRLHHDATWLLTAGPGEEAVADALCEQLRAQHIDAHRLPPADNIADFAWFLSGTDGMIAGSTGPLHIAGCLNLATVGFYPAKRSATPLRWQTCNSDDRRLAFSPPPEADTNMQRIDLTSASEAIAALIDRYHTVPSDTVSV